MSEVSKPIALSVKLVDKVSGALVTLTVPFEYSSVTVISGLVVLFTSHTYMLVGATRYDARPVLLNHATVPFQ